MAISFRPMSFHCSRTAWASPTAGLGAASFFAASCAIAGTTISPMHKANTATELIFMCFSPLSALTLARPAAGHLPSAAPLPLVLTYQFPERLFLRLRAIAASGGFILLTKALNFTQNRGAPHGKLRSSTIGEGNAVNWGWFF